MHLTQKDGVAAVLAIGVILVAAAVVGGWDWPLLGSYRVGAIAVLLLGMGQCAQGTAIQDKGSMRDPFVITMSVLGVGALGAAVWAIVANTETAFMVQVAITLAMWLISTIRHAVGTRSHAPAH